MVGLIQASYELNSLKMNYGPINHEATKACDSVTALTCSITSGAISSEQENDSINDGLNLVPFSDVVSGNDSLDDQIRNYTGILTSENAAILQNIQPTVELEKLPIEKADEKINDWMDKNKDEKIEDNECVSEEDNTSTSIFDHKTKFPQGSQE